jgi:hypothetical protein
VEEEDEEVSEKWNDLTILTAPLIPMTRFEILEV